MDTADPPFDNGFFITDSFGPRGTFDSSPGFIVVDFDVPLSSLSFYVADIDEPVERLVVRTFSDAGITRLEEMVKTEADGGDGLVTPITFTLPNIKRLTIQSANHFGKSLGLCF